MTDAGSESRPHEQAEQEDDPAAPRSFSPAYRLTIPFPLSPSPAAPSAAALREIIDGLPEQIALLDDSWNVLAVNRAWAESAAAAGIPGLETGQNYLQGCEMMAERGNGDAILLRQALREISGGERRFFEHVYFKDGKSGGDFKVNISCFESGGARFATVTRYDVTKLMALTRQYRRLERSLIRVQEEERRRIGRELHDATAQLLVALQLSMLRLKDLHSDDETAAIVAEVRDTIDRINHEVRAISYLLHPPSLDEEGLVRALDAMARGFSRRTGLGIGFWFDGSAQSWEPVFEATLYRLAQEALANVQRHAHATRVGIRLVARRHCLHLIVEDDGIGLPPDSHRSSAPLGVGIAGMRSRIEELSGRFSIRRVSSGTCLVASIPLGRPLLERGALPGSPV
ncbi:sensor histidine kinase [Sphingosinicella sp. CPCC 101087]|uniref:sensor histidine kinase n=1 Tax=Sphingosinicella sp. CPCC 101087 TaxID=2497754 RepID=UPI00101D7180|nr:ATP-binding protein [Sphingosinicella sp. CPCC 101087]